MEYGEPEFNPKSTFPIVVPGDVVRYADGSYYLVAHSQIGGGYTLVNLETGRHWSLNGMWHNTLPGKWKKVICKFYEEK